MSKIVQLASILFDSPITPTREIKSLENSFKKELKNTGTEKLDNDILADAGLSIVDKKIKKGISLITGLEIALINNEIEGIVKVIKSLENRRILIKGTIKKNTSQGLGLLHFLRILMKAGLPLMNNLLKQ